MKLARSLLEGKFDNCFVLTFNADLPFFERIIFGHLYDNDCRNLVILMDTDLYTEELKNSIPVLNFVGQRYVCAPASGVAGVRFHPKLILQTSETQGRIFLGSGNLSQPGLIHNWEVVTRIDYDMKSPNPIALTAFRSLLRYLRRLSEFPGLPEFVRRRTIRLIDSTPWADPIDQDFDWSREFQILDNLEQSLWDQVVTAVQWPVSHVRIVSPYFDPACNAFQRLFEDIQPQSVCLYIQPDQHNLDAQRLRAVVSGYRGQFEVRALNLGSRRLHAKAIGLEAQRGGWLLTGSANFSVAGLMKPARYGNAELGCLRFEEEAHYFDAWWDALHQHSCSIEIDWAAPDIAGDPPDERPPSKPSIVLSSVTLDNIGTLRLHCISRLPTDIRNVTLEFAAVDSVTWEAESWNLEGNTLSVALPDSWRQRLETPWLVTLSLETPQANLTSLPVLIHHTGQLYRYSRPSHRGDRGPIPDDLFPEDEMQLLDLMHLFQRLFIGKSSAIDTRRHRIVKERQRIPSSQEDDILEDDYDPETRVADEKVRYPDSASFYRNYYDRASFRDLMRAALRASYQAPKELRPSQEPSPPPTPQEEPSGSGDKLTQKPTVDAKAQRVRLMAEMHRGFENLIERFGEGAEDQDYLSKIPPSYPCDFFNGIAQFMGVVQHAELLEVARYAELATDLLVAFYGVPGQVGIWQQLKQLHPSETLKEIEFHTETYVRSWVLLYQSWCLLHVLDLVAQQDTLRGRLGAVARRIIEEIGDESEEYVLTASLEHQARRLWPEEKDRPNLDAFQTALLEAARCYHMDLIEEELKQVGAKAVEVRFREGIHPDLHVTMPIRDTEDSIFLSTFQKFVGINKSRHQIRAQFIEPSVTSDGCGRSIILMYQQNEGLLVYAIRYESQGHSYKYDLNLDLTGLCIENLLNFQSPRDVLNWPHKVDYTREQAD